MPNRYRGCYRALVLAAAFTGLRWGELIALRRCDVDLTTKVLRVHRSLGQTQGGEMLVGPPKSEAGVRGVALLTSWSRSWPSSRRSRVPALAS